MGFLGNSGTEYSVWFKIMLKNEAHKKNEAHNWIINYLGIKKVNIWNDDIRNQM